MVRDHFSHYKVHDCLPRNLFLKLQNMLTVDFIFIERSCTRCVSKKEDIKKHVIEDHAIGLYLNEKYKDTLLHFDTRKIFFDNT